MDIYFCPKNSLAENFLKYHEKQRWLGARLVVVMFLSEPGINLAA